MLYQARVLMLFTAQLTLHRLLPPVISNEAVNAMYDDLSEGFYDNVMEALRFQYIISPTERRSISAQISERASQCSAETRILTNTQKSELWSTIWSDEYVTRRVNEAGFKKLS